MKKQRFWIIWSIPIINIMIMNVFQYIENMYISEGAYNWGGDILLLVIIVISSVLHYVFALTIPVLLYKYKRAFNFRICLLSILSVLMANTIMFFELGTVGSQVSINNIPAYMSRPICITMAMVTIVSILIFFKSQPRLSNKRSNYLITLAKTTIKRK